jgi:6-phosphogluconate dehydrogenase
MTDIGLIGLGTMGAALALNIAENRFDLAVWNRTGSRTSAFYDESGKLAQRITPTYTLESFVKAIRPPRAIILMLPAGRIVDDMISELHRFLDHDDLIIDAGNANFHDTNRRSAGKRPFIGIGISGGEEGARFGPSVMAGGARTYWDRVAPVFNAIAAQYQGSPCAVWAGEAGAGHFVKTVHNGIEYADMQMIADIYGILRDGMHMNSHSIGGVFDRWNTGELKSYLIEITGAVATTVDPVTGVPLLDVILDKAGQKGTGQWAVIEAQQLGAPVTTIEAAVASRNLSARLEERIQGEREFRSGTVGSANIVIDVGVLERALLAAKVIGYAQGFAMISAASTRYGWALPLPEIAKVWRAGCIIRSAMLNDMAEALAEVPDRNLVFAPAFAEKLRATQGDLRSVVADAVKAGIAVPALSASLNWFDTMRTRRGTANLLQAQRDFFGRHGFQRIDSERSDHHGRWLSMVRDS